MVRHRITIIAVLAAGGIGALAPTSALASGTTRNCGNDPFTGSGGLHWSAARATRVSCATARHLGFRTAGYWGIDDGCIDEDSARIFVVACKLTASGRRWGCWQTGRMSALRVRVRCARVSGAPGVVTFSVFVENDV